MTVGELTKYLEDWAPPGAAWEKDNVGLQIGSRGDTIKNIMLSLELDEEVLTEALQNNCNFIFTHHPLIFKPIKRLDTQKDPTARLIQKIIKNDITVYSAHTNLDFTKDGVSYELAKAFKLTNIRFLELEESNQFKVVVFVPKFSLDDVSRAVFSAGAGVIGEYDNCGFSLSGEGTFKGSAKSSPVIGKKNLLEKVDEIRFEFLVDSWKLKKVIASLLDSHPYEEPAYDIYPLRNKNVNYGAGAIGDLAAGMSEKEFLEFVSRTLKTKGIKYCGGKKQPIKKVAVCGGSGSELIEKAIESKADAFVTADIKYHAYQDAAGKILLADAGHYETEIVVLNSVQDKIKSFLPSKSEIKVLKYKGSTNPIKFYKPQGA